MFDTLSNATEVAACLKETNIQNVALLTRKDHLKRATQDFVSQGINVTGFACEEVLASKHEKPERYIKHLERLFFPGHHLLTRIKENLLILYQKIDHGIRLQRFVTRRLRHAGS